MTTTLMPMGGALDERRHPEVFLEFLRRAGGAQARILIFPQASARPESGQEYADLFRQLGAGEVQSLEFRQRSQADAPEHLQRVRQASGIFFGGGVQMRLAALLGGTRLEAELLQAYRRGCIVGGTSAAPRFSPRRWSPTAKAVPLPRERILQMSPGLGFTDRFLFDQHFRQKDRLGRLIYAVASHPGILGVGIDEDTAVVVEDDSRLSMYGSGAVTIVDGRRITASDVAEAENGRPVAAAHLIVHVLTRGCVYERESGQALLAPQPFSA